MAFLLTLCAILATSTPGVPQMTFSQAPAQCRELMKQIDDLVDKVAEVSERMGRVKYRIDETIGTNESLQTDRNTLETDRATLRRHKLAIANLAVKVCACCGQKSEEQTFRQSPRKCQPLMGEIDGFVDKVADVSERMGRVGYRVDNSVGTPESLKTDRNTLETDKTTLRKHKLAVANLAVKLCECCAKAAEKEKEVSLPDENEGIILVNLIREDSGQPFNTYGFNGSVTHYFTSTVGVTGDFNANFKSQGTSDLSKISVLGGVTLVPFEGAKTTDRVTVSLHSLFGVSHFRSSSGTTTFTDNAFTMKFGGAVDVNVNRRFFIRPVQIDYAPTFFGSSAQHNYQIGAGVGFRF